MITLFVRFSPFGFDGLGKQQQKQKQGDFSYISQILAHKNNIIQFDTIHRRVFQASAESSSLWISFNLRFSSTSAQINNEFAINNFGQEGADKTKRLL